MVPLLMVRFFPFVKHAPPLPLSAWQSLNVQYVITAVPLVLVFAAAPPLAFEVHSLNEATFKFILSAVERTAPPLSLAVHLLKAHPLTVSVVSSVGLSFPFAQKLMPPPLVSEEHSLMLPPVTVNIFPMDEIAPPSFALHSLKLQLKMSVFPVLFVHATAPPLCVEVHLLKKESVMLVSNDVDLIAPPWDAVFPEHSQLTKVQLVTFSLEPWLFSCPST